MDENLKLVCRFVEDNKAFIAKNPADKIPDIFIKKYRSYVETLCEHNIELGLLEKAYGSYTGNAVFKQDWKISEELLLKLVELHQNPWAANSLGYIYYYGRTTNGVPDYDKALRYFTIASLADIPEAKYKLCDMMTDGKGFPTKIPELAFKALMPLYDDLLNEFKGENYSCEFADVAIRMGNFYHNLAKKGHFSLYYAYHYYMIAKYALELRMKHDPQYGDDSVMKRLLPKYEDAKDRFHKGIENNEPDDTLSILEELMLNNTAKVQVRKLKDAKYRITIIIEPVKHQFCYCDKELVVVPTLDFCMLINKIEIISGCAPEFSSSKRSNFHVDLLEFEEDEINFCITEESKGEEEGKLLKIIMRLKKEYLDISRIE